MVNSTIYHFYNPLLSKITFSFWSSTTWHNFVFKIKDQENSRAFKFEVERQKVYSAWKC